MPIPETSNRAHPTFFILTPVMTPHTDTRREPGNPQEERTDDPLSVCEGCRGATPLWRSPGWECTAYSIWMSPAGLFGGRQAITTRNPEEWPGKAA
jgi:hypothetical protein